MNGVYLKPIEQAVYRFILICRRDYQRLPTARLIARCFECDISTAYTHTKALRRKGVIVPVERKGQRAACYKAVGSN